MIQVKFKGSDTTWPVEPKNLDDGNVVYLCPHPNICGNYHGYNSASGLYRHTKAHAPDHNIPLPMFTSKGLGKMTNSPTPHPHFQTAVEDHVKLRLDSPSGADDAGDRMMTPPSFHVSSQNAPQAPLHAVSTH